MVVLWFESGTPMTTIVRIEITRCPEPWWNPEPWWKDRHQNSPMENKVMVAKGENCVQQAEDTLRSLAYEAPGRYTIVISVSNGTYYYHTNYGGFFWVKPRWEDWQEFLRLCSTCGRPVLKCEGEGEGCPPPDSICPHCKEPCRIVYDSWRDFHICTQCGREIADTFNEYQYPVV